MNTKSEIGIPSIASTCECGNINYKNKFCPNCARPTILGKGYVVSGNYFCEVTFNEDGSSEKHEKISVSDWAFGKIDVAYIIGLYKKADKRDKETILNVLGRYNDN